MCERNISAYELPVLRNSKIYESREKAEGKVGGKENTRWVRRVGLGQESGGDVWRCESDCFGRGRTQEIQLSEMGIEKS